MVIRGYWGQLAKAGNLNREGLVESPSYNSNDDQHMELGEVVKMGRCRKDKLDLWDKFDVERAKEMLSLRPNRQKKEIAEAGSEMAVFFMQTSFGNCCGSRASWNKH